jgi:RNA polymerase sigma factor (sigma-70 family)
MTTEAKYYNCTNEQYRTTHTGTRAGKRIRNSSKKRKREPECNPTFVDIAHFQSGLQHFLFRLDSVMGVVSREFSLEAQDLQDLHQTTFFKAWRRPERVPVERGQWTWLHTVTRNAAIDVLRKCNREVLADFEPDLDPDSETGDTLDSVRMGIHKKCAVNARAIEARKELSLMVLEAADGNVLHAQAFLLHTVHKLSLRELFQQVGLKKTKAGKIINTIWEKLKDTTNVSLPSQVGTGGECADNSA